MGVLRELFRNLVAWRALYETEGVEEVTGGDQTWSIWDVEYLYEQVPHLPPRQRQAIELCLILNIREVDAARRMGVSETNPVMMYATFGLQKLVDMVNSGSLARFRADRREVS